MDVDVETLDIHTLRLPASATYVNVILVCAMLVYIVSTIMSLRRRYDARVPLLHADTVL